MTWIRYFLRNRLPCAQNVPLDAAQVLPARRTTLDPTSPGTARAGQELAAGAGVTVARFPGCASSYRSHRLLILPSARPRNTRTIPQTPGAAPTGTSAVCENSCSLREPVQLGGRNDQPCEPLPCPRGRGPAAPVGLPRPGGRLPALAGGQGSERRAHVHGRLPVRGSAFGRRSDWQHRPPSSHEKE